MAAPEPAPRILVVDDDPGIRDVLSDYLGQHGFRVRAAASAARARAPTRPASERRRDGRIMRPP